MVDAGRLVISLIRLAARPVGAAKMIWRLKFSVILRMAFVMVLFPVPGPPVIIWNFSSYKAKNYPLFYYNFLWFFIDISLFFCKYPSVFRRTEYILEGTLK